jgi:MSHA biogenesis protein MshK
MSPRNAATLVALAALAMAESALAQLTDPTRPPNLSGLPFGAEVAAPSGPILQSIVLSPTRRLALINGKLTGIGDRVGAATLVGIDFDSVRLREGGGTKVVKLLPEVQKRDKDTEARPVNTNPNPMGDVQ